MGLTSKMRRKESWGSRGQGRGESTELMSGRLILRMGPPGKVKRTLWLVPVPLLIMHLCQAPHCLLWVLLSPSCSGMCHFDPWIAATWVIELKILSSGLGMGAVIDL